MRTTISYVLFDAMLRVQLFSNPQQTVAAMTNSEPYENLKLSAPSNERRTLASVMSAIAAHRRFETASRKTNSAISVVATISKLPSNEALADEPCRMPSMRKMGAAMSRTIMPTTYGRSLRESGADALLSFALKSYSPAIPMPAPR